MLNWCNRWTDGKESLMASGLPPYLQVIVVRGAGRAFCSGGDVVAMYHAQEKEQQEYVKEEYALDLQVDMDTNISIL